MSQDEQKLIRKAKQGDHDSMEALFRQHVDGAVRLAYLITKNWAAAEDAVQEGFIQAFRSLHTFQEGKPFKPWFTKIVVNKSKWIMNRWGNVQAPLEWKDINTHRSFSPEEHTLEKEELDALFTAINALDDNHRVPLILKYLTGLSERETAEVLGIPVSTVKSRLYTARQRLMKYLAEEEGSEDSDL